MENLLKNKQKQLNTKGKNKKQTTEEESNKKIKNIKNKWLDKTIKTIEYDPNNNPTISEQKEIYNKMVNDERGNIEN